jgi:hypothetical protein
LGERQLLDEKDIQSNDGAKMEIIGFFCPAKPPRIINYGLWKTTFYQLLWLTVKSHYL